MTAIKVHFGASRPAEIDYKSINGMAEVWLYKDIHTEQDADGNTEFVADGVCFTTRQSRDEVLANKDKYFVPDAEKPTLEGLSERVDEVEGDTDTALTELAEITSEQGYTIDDLANAVMELAELIGG